MQKLFSGLLFLSLFALYFLKQPGFNPTDPAIILVYVINAIVFIFAFPKLLKKHQVLLFYPFFVFAYVMLVALAGATFLQGVLSYFVHFSFIFLAIGLGSAFRKESNMFLLSLLCLFALANSIYGIFEFASSGAISTVGNITAGFSRVSGFFPNPNMAGTFTAFAVVVIIYFRDYKYWPRILCDLSFLICISYTLVTFSRRAYLMLAVYLFIFWLFQKNKFSFFRGPILSVSIILVLTTFLLNIGILNRFESILDTSYSSNRIRLDALIKILPLWTSDFGSFLIGSGVGSIGFISKFLGNTEAYTVDNYFLLILVEFGLFGMLLIIFPYIKYLIISHKKNNIREKILFTTVFWSYIVSASVGLTSITFPISFLLAVLLALGINYSYERKIH